MARVPAILLLLAFLTAGCASDDDDDADSQSTTTTTSGGSTATVSGSASISVTGTGEPGNQTRNVKVQDSMYSPDELTIKRGDSVNFTHEGQLPHSVTADVGLFDSSPGCSAATPDQCMKNGDHFEFEFDTVGTFTYKCKVHPTTMTGTITVTN